MKMDNKLLKVEHDANGIWYFTTYYKAAMAMGMQASHLKYYVDNNKEYKGWSFEYVDGGDVIFRYINPSRI